MHPIPSEKSASSTIIRVYALTNGTDFAYPSSVGFKLSGLNSLPSSLGSSLLVVGALLCMQACGSITFPDAPGLPESDAAVLDAMGVVDPDGGVPIPDTGEPLGCIPVEAPEFPPAWPYARTKAAYEANFFNLIKGATASNIGCSGGSCHSNDAEPPFLPTRAELDTDALLQKAIDELWSVTSRSGLKSGTVLRSAHLEGGEADDNSAKRYTTMEDSQLYLFEKKTIDCRWVPAYQARPDGGGGCPDAGGAGGEDGGTGSSAQCECPLPMLELSHCEAP